jgi:hypothetical protein
MQDLVDNVNTNNTTYHTSLFIADFTLHRGWHGFLFHLLHMPTEKHSLINVYGLSAYPLIYITYYIYFFSL